MSKFDVFIRIVVLLFIGAILVGALVVGVWAFTEFVRILNTDSADVRRTAPCEEFAAMAISLVPARCYLYFTKGR